MSSHSLSLKRISQTAYIITRCILSCDALNIQPTAIRRHYHWNYLARYNFDYLPIRRHHGHIIKHNFSPYDSTWFHTSRRYFSRDTATTLGDKEITPSDLDAISDLLKTSYDDGETDRVQDVLISNSILPLLLDSNIKELKFTTMQQVACHLVQAAVKAASHAAVQYVHRMTRTTP
eukprot:scaffold13562_cov109-Cyclotella_meneghiniana.AAC.2